LFRFASEYEREIVSNGKRKQVKKDKFTYYETRRLYIKSTLTKQGSGTNTAENVTIAGITNQG